MADLYRSWENAFQSWRGVAGAATNFAGRLLEAERVSDRNRAIVAIDTGFGEYNRSLIEREWEEPGGAVGAKRRIGQIPETMIKADHEAMVKTQRDWITANIHNRQAQAEALQDLTLKADRNWTDVRRTYETHRVEWFTRQSDDNIEKIVANPSFDRAKKLAMVHAQYVSDVETFVRHDTDAAAAEQKVIDRVNNSWAMAGALEASRATGWQDARASEKWLEENTASFLDAESRESMFRVVANRVGWEQQEAARQVVINDKKVDEGLDRTYLEFIDSIDGLRAMRESIPQAGYQNQDRVGGRIQEVTARINYLEGRLGTPLAPETRKEWQTRMADHLLTQLVQAQADGRQPGELRKLIDDFNIERDEKGGIKDYRISGADIQKFYRDFVEPETSSATATAALWIRAYAEDRGKKLTAVGEEQLVNEWWRRYRTHPDATEEEMLKAAEAIAQPIVKQNLARLFDGVGAQAVFGDDRTMTTQEQALYDVQARGFTWASKEPGNIEYLQQLSAKWLTVAQQGFPNENIVRAEPDTEGHYGLEGVPLLYSEQGQLYRWIVEGKRAVLQRFAQNRAGQRVWEPVMAPQTRLPETVTGPTPAPAVPRPTTSAAPTARTFKVAEVAGGPEKEYHRDTAGVWRSATGLLALPRVARQLDALEARR